MKLKLKMEVGNNQARLIFSGPYWAVIPLRNYLKKILADKSHYIPPKTYSISDFGLGWGVELPDSSYPEQVRLDFWFPSKYCFYHNAQIHANEQINLLIAAVVQALPAGLVQALQGGAADVAVHDVTGLKDLQFIYPAPIGEGVEVDGAVAENCCAQFLAAVEAFKKFHRVDSADARWATKVISYEDDKAYPRPNYLGTATLNSTNKTLAKLRSFKTSASASSSSETTASTKNDCSISLNPHRFRREDSFQQDAHQDTLVDQLFLAPF